MFLGLREVKRGGRQAIPEVERLICLSTNHCVYGNVSDHARDASLRVSIGKLKRCTSGKTEDYGAIAASLQCCG